MMETAECRSAADESETEYCALLGCDRDEPNTEYCETFGCFRHLKQQDIAGVPSE